MKISLLNLMCILLSMVIFPNEAQSQTPSEMGRDVQAVIDKYFTQCPSMGSGFYMGVNYLGEKSYIHARQLKFEVGRR